MGEGLLYSKSSGVNLLWGKVYFIVNLPGVNLLWGKVYSIVNLPGG